MEHLEVVIFDEIDDYQEKIKGLTFRQWIFAVLIAIVVIPTYLLLPKYTIINKDIASYIVILETAVIGFFGFIKIHNLNAEQIVPYWYRNYFIFSKPIEYMTDKEYAEAHEKKNKKTSKNKIQKCETEALEQKEVTNNEIVENSVNEVKVTNNQPIESKPKLTKKQLRQQQKQEKMLEKAKAKYGYILDEQKEDENEPKEADVLIDNTSDNSINEEQNQVENVIQKEKRDDTEDLLNSLSTEEKKKLLKKLINDE